MLKKAIAYKDLDGVLRTEDFYFDLSVPEVTELEVSMPGGMSAHWTRIVERKDAKEMLKSFKDLIAMAYGERSEDGRYFLKEDDNGRRLGRLFLQSPAYSVLFMELLGTESSDDAFTEFLKGCVPSELLDKMPTEPVKLPAAGEGTDDETTPEDKRTVEQYSRQELLDMPQVRFDKLAGTDPTKWSRPVMEIAFQRKSQSK